MTDEHVPQIEEGMRLLKEYAEQLALDRGHAVSVAWRFQGPLHDAPSKYIMTLMYKGRGQDVEFPREPIEDYPGGAGIGRTQAFVKEGLRRVLTPKTSETNFSFGTPKRRPARRS